MSVVKWSRSAFFATSSGRPGSWIGTSPRESDSTFSGHDVARPHLVAQLGEAGGRHQADPADADDADRFLLSHEASRLPTGAGYSARTERAIASICFSYSVSSSVFEIQ